MNMKIVLIVLSIALPQMAWGMDPVVKARNVLMRIEELQEDLSQDQAKLERLQRQQRQIVAELNDPRIVQLVDEEQEAQRNLQNARQAEADIAAAADIAEGADAQEQALRRGQEAAYRVSELTDKLKGLTDQMQAMQLEEKQARLEKIGASIEGVRESVRDLEAEIEDEQSTLESMDAAAVAEARNILARKAGASIQAPVLTTPVLSETVVTPQAQAAEQARLAELRAAQKEAQERRERQQAAQAAQAAQEAQERQAAQIEEERAFQEAQAAEQVRLAKQAAELRAAREARAQRAGEQIAPIAVAPVSVSVPAASVAAAPTSPAAAALAPAALLPAPAAPHFVQQHKKEIGAIIAAITVAIATYIGRRTYMNKKNRLIKKYGLDQLTPLQNAIWRATALASIRMPWYLQYLVRNNPRSLTELVGSDPRALAELYYGHKPTGKEVQAFLAKFFGGVK